MHKNTRVKKYFHTPWLFLILDFAQVVRSSISLADILRTTRTSSKTSRIEWWWLLAKERKRTSEERWREGGMAKGKTGGGRLRRTLKHRKENIRDSRRTAWWLNFAKTVKWPAMNHAPLLVAFLLCFWRPNILRTGVARIELDPHGKPCYKGATSSLFVFSRVWCIETIIFLRSSFRFDQFFSE